MPWYARIEPWYVLTDGEKFWGQLWETFNNSPRKPRYDMRNLNDSVEFRPVTCHGKKHVKTEINRAAAITGVNLYAVPITFKASGKYASIELVKS